MRTTLTLDDDVAIQLKSEMRSTGKSLKDVVNYFLRIGLNSRKQGKPARRFTVKTRPLGPREGLSFDNIGELLEQVEGPNHK